MSGQRKDMTHGSKIRGQRGFSLVEMLVAITILAIGLLGILGMQVYAIRANAYSSNVTVAENLAQQKIEFLKNFGYQQARGVSFGKRFVICSGNPSCDTASYDSISDSSYSIPAADRLSIGAISNMVIADIESPWATDNCWKYIRSSFTNGCTSPLVNVFNDLNTNTNYVRGIYDGVPDQIPDPPFDRFKRITLMKLINGVSATDYSMIIKVIVYWKNPAAIGGESKVTFTTMKTL